jgi:quercetin dioxygenase-like cupin family protein
MKKLATLSVVAALVAAAFVAGVAVGKTTVQPKFIAAEEVKWDDVGGPKLGNLTGDYKKGAYSALFKIPAGFTSPMHLHTGAYEAIEIQGTTSHWLKGEDGTKAKKMTPGSYWSMPAKVEHVSSCAPGQDCIFYVWQKKKFDFLPAKEDKAATAAAAGAAPTKAPGAAAGAGATKAPAAGAGSAAPTKAPGTGAGSAAPKAPAGAGSAAPVKK